LADPDIEVASALNPDKLGIITIEEDRTAAGVLETRSAGHIGYGSESEIRHSMAPSVA